MQARGFDLGGHLRDLELDALEFGDGFAELLALLRVLAGVFPGAAGQPDHLRADADAAFVQRLDGDLVSLADFAQHILLRHAAVFENQLAGGRGADAQLVFLLADGESGEIFLDHEGGDAFVSGRGIDGGEEDEDAGFLAVGDPELAAVENVVAALEFRAGLQRECVGAGAGFAERVGAARCRRPCCGR